MAALAPMTESGCSCEIIVKLLLLCHQPYFMKEKGSSFAWPCLVRHLETSSKIGVKGLLDRLMPEILKEVFGDRGCGNEEEDEVEAAINCVGELSTLGCESFMGSLMSIVGAVEDFETHSTLKDLDFKIYFTPEGELSDEYGTYKAEVVDNKNVRRAKGRFKSSGGSFGGVNDSDDYISVTREGTPNQSRARARARTK